MAAFSGTAGQVKFGGTAGTAITGIAEWSFDGSMSPVETTEFGEDFDSYVPSVRNISGSFSGNRDDTSAQSDLVGAFLGGSAVALSLYENATNYWDVGTAYITSMSPSLSAKGKGEISFSFQGSGAATYN
jgi:hypothetical protein